MTKRPKLRTAGNADRVCALLAEGCTLRQIAGELRIESASSITDWVRADAEFAAHYARAMELRCERMAEEILEIADDNYTGPDGRADNGAVQQARLRVDSRRWLLSKLMPRKYGDKITQEITGEEGGALITRIELVPVAPKPRPELPARDGGDEATVPLLRALPSR